MAEAEAEKPTAFPAILVQKAKIIDLKKQCYISLGIVDDEVGKQDKIWNDLELFMSKLLECLKLNKIYLIYKSTIVKIDDWYAEYNYRDVHAVTDLFLRYLESDYVSEIDDDCDHVHEIKFYQHKIIRTFQQLIRDYSCGRFCPKCI